MQQIAAYDARGAFSTTLGISDEIGLIDAGQAQFMRQIISIYRFWLASARYSQIWVASNHMDGFTIDDTL